MTIAKKREKCEAQIIEKLKEIQEIYKKYNPKGNYLSMSIFNGNLSVNNEYWDEDSKRPISTALLSNDDDVDAIRRFE